VLVNVDEDRPRTILNVGGSCDRGNVVTARDIERIPPGNLKVPRDEFVVVWSRPSVAARNSLVSAAATGIPLA
jgi:hypothetical protein